LARARSYTKRRVLPIEIGANLSGSGPPDIDTREAVTGHGQDEDKKVCFGVIVNETRKPRAKGPADPIERHQRSKDGTKAFSLEEVGSHNGGQRGGDRVPHAEQESIGVGHPGDREDVEKNEEGHPAHTANDTQSVRFLPSDLIGEDSPKNLGADTDEADHTNHVRGEKIFQSLVRKKGDLVGQNGLGCEGSREYGKRQELKGTAPSELV